MQISTISNITVYSLMALLLAAPQVVQPTEAQAKPGRELVQLLSNRPLTAPVADFPIPPPQGSKFLTGYEDRYNRGRPTTYMQFENPSGTDDLARWYKQSIKSAGYSVTDTPAQANSRGTTLYAYRGPSSFSVVLTPRQAGPNLKTTIAITYHH